MVRALTRSGTAILNGDDPNVRWMASQTRARSVTFGLEAHNDVRAADIRLDHFVLAGFERADVEHHVDFGRAVEDGAAGLVGLDVRRGRGEDPPQRRGADAGPARALYGCAAAEAGGGLPRLRSPARRARRGSPARLAGSRGGFSGRVLARWSASSMTKWQCLSANRCAVLPVEGETAQHEWPISPVDR